MGRPVWIAGVARAFDRLRRRPAPSVLRRLVDDGSITLGTGSYIAEDPTFQFWLPDGAQRPHVVIGNYCSIGARVTFLVNGDHRTDWTSTYPLRHVGAPRGTVQDGHPRVSGPITIGHDVWIGFGAILLGGITIGHGAVVGAGAVVSRSVPPYAIVVGNPASVHRYRFDPTTVERLLRLRWWELDRAQVDRLVDLVNAPLDIDRLEDAVNVERRSGGHEQFGIVSP